MELKKFKDYVEGFNEGTIFKYGISEPFSWRGIYAEVAFSITMEPMSRETLLERIQMAYDNTFIGYKGGEYKYHDYTDIHFEDGIGSWTDGGYCSDLISRITDEDPYQSQEEKLVKLIIK